MTEVVFLQISNQTGRLCRSGIVHSWSKVIWAKWL
jgi:hypothetical protein